MSIFYSFEFIENNLTVDDGRMRNRSDVIACRFLLLSLRYGVHVYIICVFIANKFDAI